MRAGTTANGLNDGLVAALELIGDGFKQLASAIRALPAPPPAAPVALPPAARLWELPGETRLGVVDVAAMVGKPKSWVYRRTSAKSGYLRLPHRRLDGSIFVTVADLRRYITEREIVAGI